ncbi:unnamed protein product [Ambrosiozyma monospora]|uniref:Unnamed protein product n=1 Tax=Ambrosiozyma monospora TaxID=43982 RepID=A0ACB5T7H3_AMBMO|nr:unnamed protein product [Ambrosiozyma monospora]
MSQDNQQDSHKVSTPSPQETETQTQTQTQSQSQTQAQQIVDSKSNSTEDHSQPTQQQDQSTTDNPTTDQNQQEQQIPDAPRTVPERIFIGNLPYAVTEDQVRGLTDLEIVSVEIPQKQFFDKVKGEYILQSKGYGFITFTSEADATKAIETINGKFIGEREIYAKTAVPQNPFRRHNNYNNNDQLECMEMVNLNTNISDTEIMGTWEAINTEMISQRLQLLSINHVT